MESNPAIFISYSRDSNEHCEKVLSLSERLRSDGVDTILDQYLNGSPPQGWPRWMLDKLDTASSVLVICTETYYRRFRGHESLGIGKGADWEGMLITQEMYDRRSTTTRFVPVLLDGKDRAFIPDPLRAATHYTLTSESAYQNLYDFLLGQAGVEPRPIGTPRTKLRRKGTVLKFGEPNFAVIAKTTKQMKLIEKSSFREPSQGVVDDWTFASISPTEISACNEALCRDYGRMGRHDLLEISTRWRAMAEAFTEATKRAGYYHGIVLHDKRLQRLTKLLETALSERSIDGVNRLGRCLRRPDDDHLHWALAALDELDARLRAEIGTKRRRARSGDKPPEPAAPNPRSVANNDLQKKRWGGKARGHGRRLYVSNVERLKKYFFFDAVLESTDGAPLQGPFIFHLHPSYSRSKIKILKPQFEGKQAVLKECNAEGTYTIGVQFKDAAGEWKSLEYDLALFDGGSLAKKYG